MKETSALVIAGAIIGTIGCAQHAHRTHKAGHLPSGTVSVADVQGSGDTNAITPDASASRIARMANTKRRDTHLHLTRSSALCTEAKRGTLSSSCVQAAADFKQAGDDEQRHRPERRGYVHVSRLLRGRYHAAALVSVPRLGKCEHHLTHDVDRTSRAERARARAVRWWSVKRETGRLNSATGDV